MASPNDREESQIIARAALRKALRQLPKAQYDAYLYVEVLGYTTREAGTILNRDFGTVAENLRSAKASLQKYFSVTPTK